MSIRRGQQANVSRVAKPAGTVSSRPSVPRTVTERPRDDSGPLSDISEPSSVDIQQRYKSPSRGTSKYINKTGKPHTRGGSKASYTKPITAIIKDDAKELDEIESQFNARKRPNKPVGTFSVLNSVESMVLTRDEVVNNKLHVEVTTIHDTNKPTFLNNTLYDSHMGPSSYKKICTTCNHPDAYCPGHFGYIDLGDPTDSRQKSTIDPYIDPYNITVVRGLYNIICRGCSVNLFTTEQYHRMGIANLAPKARIRALEEYINKLRDSSAKITCPNLHNDNKIHYDLCNNNLEAAKISKGDIRITVDSKPVNNADLYKLFKAMTDEQVTMLGLKYNPKDLLKTFVVIIPPAMRNPSINEEDRRDKIDRQYISLLKNIIEIKSSRKTPSAEATKNLHDNIFHLISSSKGKTTRRGGVQDDKGYKEEIAGKEGLIRGNQTGKRVDHSSRGVTTGNNNIPLGYIGIPAFICDNSYDQIYITEHTKPYIKRLYDEGKLVHYVPRSGYYRRMRLKISQITKNGKAPRFVNGDAVTTTLIEGRPVLPGRNPSIHKVSILGAKLMRVEGNTVQMHNSITTAFNMDYDGDEGHQTYPQSLLAQAEVKYLISVAHNIINTENSAAIVGLVMDAITMMYLVTSSAEVGFFLVAEDEYKEMVALLKRQPNRLSGLYRLDERLAYHKINKYSARGIISLLFPPDFYYESKAKDGTLVKVVDGILISGTITKAQVGPTRSSIAQAIYLSKGENRALDFINDGMKLSDYYMTEVRGFSVGIGDTKIGNPYVKQVTDKTINSIKNSVVKLERLAMEKPNDPIHRLRIENEIINLLQSKAESVGRKLTKEVLAGDNAFRMMIEPGAKGTIFHTSQMIATGGQQFELGSRIDPTYSNGTRVSAYDNFNSVNIEEHGYIVNSLGEGFNPRDQLNHHIATRVTLVDTATKTVDAGEYHHLANKALLDLTVTYDSALVDANGMIVQFIAGSGLDLYQSTPFSYEGESFPYFANINYMVEEINAMTRWDLK